MGKAPLPHRIVRLPWDASWEGQRLRKILQQAVPELGSRGAFLVVTNRLVSVENGSVIGDADERLRPGTTLLVDLRHGVHGEGESRHPGLLERMRVVFDDADVVVVAKRAGVLVQPLEDEEAAAEQGPPLVELLKHYWKARGTAVVNPMLVQRLDRDTSGLLVLAKHAEAARALQEQLKPPRRLKRHYLAIVAGRFRTQKGTWKTYLGQGPAGLRQSVADIGAEPPEDKELQIAETHYRVAERLEGATLLELELETGRTHQIRIHCAESGHPVLADEVYQRLGESMLMRLAKGKFRARSPWNPAKEAERLVADGEFELTLPKKLPKRLALHACRLSFEHPRTGERMTFEESLPGDLKVYAKTLTTKPREDRSGG